MKTRDYQVKIITKIIETNIEIILYRKSLAQEQKHKDICDKMLRMSKKALKELQNIKHEDIINSLYNSLVIRNEVWFSYFAPTITSKNTKKWDSTKKGYAEFCALEKEAKQIAKEKAEMLKKEQEAIENAKKNGDKIDMVYDDKEKRLKPVITKVDNYA